MSFNYLLSFERVYSEFIQVGKTLYVWLEYIVNFIKLIWYNVQMKAYKSSKLIIQRNFMAAPDSIAPLTTGSWKYIQYYILFIIL